MIHSNTIVQRTIAKLVRYSLLSFTFACALIAPSPFTCGQEVAGPVPIDAAEIEAVMNDQPAAESVAPAAPSGIDLLTLIARGGTFMIPIGLMSLIVVTIAVERLLRLRRRKFIPPLLAADLDALIDPLDQFDPTAAFDACAEQPSPAGRVIKSMLMRTGQPMADIERAAAETVEREGDRFASPIQWLHFAAAATPLMGLLGTVWGMIVAFHESTTLTADRSRSEQLSEGIYTALVTTLAGLIVAIPAAMLALYLENRLAKLLHQVEQLAFAIAPALTRFRGQRRMDTTGRLHSMEIPTPPPVDQAADLKSKPTPPAKPKHRGKSKRVS